MKNIVGKRVKEARRKFKPRLSQEELAARLELNGLDITRTMLAKIEAGSRRVTDYELMALAITLKVTPGELMDEEALRQIYKKK